MGWGTTNRRDEDEDKFLDRAEADRLLEEADFQRREDLANYEFARGGFCCVMAAMHMGHDGDCPNAVEDNPTSEPDHE